jgi:CoA:oxalate CoA-transferase
MSKPFEGIKVLDMTEIMAGPMVGAYLGDMGADVIKVEKPTGDSMRANKQNDLVYLCHNRSKRGIVLDYKTPAGLAALLRIASQCDVLVENSRPGVAERRGYGYEAVHRLNPRLIYCSISAFGTSGPYADKPAVDYIIQGVSGLMSWTGPEDGAPVRLGPIVSDFAGGAMATSGVLTALYVREKTGRGQKVDISLLDASLHVAAQRLLEYPVRGGRLRPMGTKHPWNHPHTTYRTQDGALNLGIQEEHRWISFCDAIGHPELSADPRFANNASRVKHAKELDAILEPLFLTRTTTVWLEILKAADQYVGVLNNLEQVLDDPQVVHNKILVDVAHPDYQGVKLVDTAVKLSETPGGIARRSPLLGEHTEEVLSELGFSATEIRGLKA